MDTPFLASLLEQYQWQLSLYAFVGIMAATFIGKRLLLLVPAFREADRLNRKTFRDKMARPNYAANQK